MQVKILYHGRCFDGFSSAAVFARFARLHLGARGPLRLQGLSHGAPVPIAPSVFDADLHAIVDFRYSAHPRLDWWFDHHQTAFITAEERAVYEVRHGARHYWDPRAASCAGYMARMLSEHHGFDAAPLAELVRWVDLIDTARFPDARTAVALEAPALQLMTVLEHVEDGPLADRIVAGLAEGDVEGTARLPEIQSRFRPLLAAQQRTITTLRDRMEHLGDVILVDLTPDGADVAYNRFAPYFLAPEATYVVSVLRTRDAAKIGVGTNPWRLEARRHDLAELCRARGGGGHPVVGGVTFPASAIHDAVGVARELAGLLASS